jgi:hypothetical protein
MGRRKRSLGPVSFMACDDNSMEEDCLEEFYSLKRSPTARRTEKGSHQREVVAAARSELEVMVVVHKL